jgi:hypothetical protein
MPSAVPTTPASIYHPGRADAVQQMKCAMPSQATEPAVLDFNRVGVLLEAETRLRIGTEHLCQFQVAGQSIFLPARVTHMRYQPPVGGRGLYQIGLAFLLTSAEHCRSLETLTTLLGLRLLGV